MPEKEILVTGGTGTTGRRLVDALRRRGAAVRVASRHPGPAAGGVHPVPFDWTDPATHPPVLAGVERVYLVRPGGTAGDPMAVLSPFLSAAGRAGVRRVVLLHSTVSGPVGHPEVAEAVRSAVPEWAVLRASWFMQNVIGDHPTAAAIRDRREIATATGTGRVGFVDAADIAAVAAELLLSDTPRADHMLTGPEALSYPDLAATIRDLTGIPVRHVDLSPDELAARWTAAGLPAPLAHTAVDLDLAIARGGQDTVTATVEEITGRPPRPFREFVRAHREAFG